MSETNRGKLMGGSIAAGAGILLAVVGFVIPFIGAGASIALGGFGIVLGISGYALGARRLGVAAILLCTLAMFFGLAVSQGLVPGMEGFTPRVSVSHSFLPGTHA